MNVIMEFFDTIRDKVISFRKGVRNLCYFFNVIWNYRDFDYSYMLGVEERIMESMKKYFEECHIAVLPMVKPDLFVEWRRVDALVGKFLELVHNSLSVSLICDSKPT